MRDLSVLILELYSCIQHRIIESGLRLMSQEDSDNQLFIKVYILCWEDLNWLFSLRSTSKTVRYSKLRNGAGAPSYLRLQVASRDASLTLN
jgi:hypothetical protein